MWLVHKILRPKTICVVYLCSSKLSQAVIRFETPISEMKAKKTKHRERYCEKLEDNFQFEHKIVCQHPIKLGRPMDYDDDSCSTVGCLHKRDCVRVLRI